MQRHHHMPFGARVEEGAVHFGLWAPGAERVELLLESGPALAMPATGAGWFELTTDQARPGSRYRYRIDGGQAVPDPASRHNPEDVHGPSEVIDPAAYAWGDGSWQGRPFHEAVFYELHVGSFSDSGDFAGVERHLDELAELGVTALELMPVADFPGARNWGYDGVLPYAPDSRYGRPEALKRLIDAAHQRSLMVFLDVVYNHFGPEGNYLHVYAPQFFTDRHQTPWGAGINFDDTGSRTVRDFFIHNALYWLDEYHLDGLRLDAVHAIADDSEPDILEELAAAVRAGPGRHRHVHLVLENDANRAGYLRHGYDAQWNDDFHHALHVLLSGETDGYYADYAERPRWLLGRCLAEGFGYQGEASGFRGGQPRGEPSADLPVSRFVVFAQNHDQVGNRALGERLAQLAPQRLELAASLLLLAPSPPLLFMGEEWGSRRPFPFFCDFGPELAQAVTEGRRREFEAFERFRDPAARQAIPDPNDPATFEAARLERSEREQGVHARLWRHYRALLELRRRTLMPRLAELEPQAQFELLGATGLRAQWRLGGRRYTLSANLGDAPLEPAAAPGAVLHAQDGAEPERLPPWTAIWQLEGAHG